MRGWLAAAGAGSKVCARVARQALLGGPSTSPLEVTSGKFNAAKSWEGALVGSMVCARWLTRLSCRRLRLAQPVCACGLWARSAPGVRWLRLPARCRTRTVVICEGDF